MRSLFRSLALVAVLLVICRPCMAGGAPVRHFSPDNFVFSITVSDNGAGPSGGWQEAKAGLVFGPTPSGATVCMSVIGMPLRNSVWGKITTKDAPTYTSNVANAAAAALEKDGFFNLPPGIFCSKFETEMKKQWGDLYPYMGAKVTVKSPS